MKIESNDMLPFLGIQVLNRSPQIETKVCIEQTYFGLHHQKVCIKPTNLGLHHQSHVDSWYEKSLLRTMLD